MKPLITLLLLLLFYTADAQKQPAFGQIDTADLRLTDCDFEKGANAMVLFTYGKLQCNPYDNILNYHKRIKILTEAGKAEGSYRIEYVSKRSLESIKNIVAQTINLEGNVIKITPVDKKQIYVEKIDKYRKAVVIAFPEVRKGSIIEIKYTWEGGYVNVLPRWHFQGDLPVRYSELVADKYTDVDQLTKVYQDYENSNAQMLKSPNGQTFFRNTWALGRVPSYKTEPFTPFANKARQGIYFYKGGNFGSWTDLAGIVAGYDTFGLQLKQFLPGTDDIIKKAAALNTKTEKVASIFNAVKTAMVWNNDDSWHTYDGIRKAWTKRTGNATEINLILYKLLEQAGVSGFPVLVSTPDNGVVEPDIVNLYQMNKTVVFVPVDSVAYYILDASDKKQSYDEVPSGLLNTSGLAVNMDKKGLDTNRNALAGKLFTIACFTPVSQRVNIQAAITANSKMTGSAQIFNYSYDKASVIKQKNDQGAVYADVLKNKDNEITINALKFDNLETDILPLVQQIDFSANLTQSDDKYVIFNTNLFSEFRTNPFSAEQRMAAVEFPYPINYTITGRYTIPDNYTAETLPKNVSIKTEDNGITLRRIVASDGNIIAARYIISRTKSYYTKEEYPALREFYKKLFEVLNEPVVLKKAG